MRERGVSDHVLRNSICPRSPSLTPPEKEAKVGGLLETPHSPIPPHTWAVFFIEDKKRWKCNARDLTISERKRFFPTYKGNISAQQLSDAFLPVQNQRDSTFYTWLNLANVAPI